MTQIISPIVGTDDSNCYIGGYSSTPNDIDRMTAVNGVVTSINSSTTAALIPGLTLKNPNGEVATIQPGIYKVEIKIIGSADGAGGIKIGLGGTATVPKMGIFARFWNAGSVVGTPALQTTFNDASGNTSTYTDIDIEGSITVSGQGSIGLIAAQNASSLNDTTIGANSSITLTRVS